jgi:hypothetical protein
MSKRRPWVVLDLTGGSGGGDERKGLGGHMLSFSTFPAS